jgi:NAD(P)-dependent dehydrogenase (short-subunit alcohol dehydrogenase family)
MRSLQDKVAVVTGASSGIGRATAQAFADQGATVAVVARRAEALDEVVAQCRTLGGGAIAFPADVTDADAIDDVARETAGRFGRIDVWVNDAAVHMFGPIEQVPVDEWHRVVEVNLFGTFHGIRAVLPWMREQGEGVIVNVSSVLGHMGAPQQSAYVASKFAVRALSDCTRQEVEELPDLHVCTVLPGPVDTPLFEHGANHTGREVQPLSPTIDANRVADAIVRCAVHPRREVAVGATPKLSVAAAKLAPGLTDRVAGHLVERDHFKHEPAPARSGNLFEPFEGTGAVSGGWSRVGNETDDGEGVSSEAPPSRNKAAVVIGTAAVMAAAGAVGVVTRRNRSG